MPDTFNDLWASLKIFQSNFTARYGSLFNLIVAASVLALILFVLIRAALAGRKSRRGPSPMHGTPPDHNLTQRAAQSLSYAVRIPSVTGDIEALKAMNQFLRQRYPMVMETMDCACLPDGSMLLRWRSPRTKLDPVLLCGHLDVVPGGEGWTVCQPFEGLREDGRIYGRGAVDCKGVVIAMLEAAESLIAQGFMPKREVYFAFGADEEIGGPKGSRAIAATLERQGMKFDLILDEGGSIEDTRRDGRKHAAAFVGMGEKRQCTMGLTVHCPGGHSSQPGRVTALGMLSEAICRIESAQPHIRVIPLVRRTLESSMAAFPFGKRLVLSSRLLFRLAGGRLFRGDPEMMALLRTTVAVTRIDGSFPAPNMLPATAAALLNVRLLPGDRPEALRADLKSLLADLPIEVELLSVGEESFITLEQQPMYRMLRDVLLERYPNLPCVPTLMSSACDARHYSNLSDCILRFSPMVTGENAGWNWHAGNEFLSERSLGIAAEVYRDLLRRL